MLHDRLICGINNNQMQRRFLAEPKLSFEKAYELVKAMKTSDHDMKELQGPPSIMVNKLNKATAAATRTRPANHRIIRGNFYQCGGKHCAMKCKFCQVEYWLCKKIGHIEKVCHSKLK